ncbi:MAG TPA: calcium-binding protein, partial [Xanthobacteraceae bacterium]|nr:calcium-binding protein [Xanthobacteraceae bacterium]
DDVESIDFTARGGADKIVVNDLSGTDVVEVNVNLAANPEANPNAGDGAADEVIVHATGGDDVAVIVGDASGVSVLGLAAQVNITGAEGAFDKLHIFAGDGDDVIEASGVAPGSIGLVLDGGNGDDIIIGSDGDDVLIGGPGDDVLIGGAGNDTASGGAGNDQIMYYGANAGIDTVNGGSGVDMFDARALGSAVWVDLAFLGVEAWTSGVATATDTNATTQIADLTSIEDIVGSDFADTLRGDGGNNTIIGLQGDDVIDGRAGDDILIAGAGNDTVMGGDGNDSIRYYGANAGTDTVNGGTGIDTFDLSSFGSAGWVDLTYADGKVWTQDAPDLTSGTWRKAAELTSVENIVGTAFSDAIAGDTQDNRIGYTGGYDTIDGRGGVDTIDFSGFGSAIWVDLTYTDGEAWTQDAPNLTGGTWRKAAELSGVENIAGTGLADALAGDAGANRIDGGAGNDTLIGRGGADTFVFRAGYAHDTVNDFTSGDAIELSGFAGLTTFNDLVSHATQQGTDTLIDFGAGDQLLLHNVLKTNLTAADFHFV